jgi:hypothetical protein
MSDAPCTPAAVVVAHPAVSSAERVVLCFGDPFERPKMSRARRRAVAALPLSNLVDLALPESGAGFSVDWSDPTPTATGIAITDAAARARYDANYARLVDRLREVLAGCREVYTHNPWGEYGHAEHIQVYRAVTALQAELGYRIWFSNYVRTSSWPLARRIGGAPCWTERRTVRPDTALARRLMGVYWRHGAWTWSWFHRWPAEETLYAQAPAGDPGPRHPLAGEWLLDVASLRWWLPWRAARRRLD